MKIARCATLAILALSASLLGCSTMEVQKDNADIESIAQECRPLFADQQFALVDLRSESHGKIAEATFAALSKTAGPSASAKSLAKQIQAAPQVHGNLAVTGGSNHMTIQIIRDAFSLCQDKDLSKLNFVFVGSTNLNEEVRKIVEGTGAKYQFKEYRQK